MPPRRNEPRRTSERIAKIPMNASPKPPETALWPDEGSDLDPSYDPACEGDDDVSETDSDDEFIVSEHEEDAEGCLDSTSNSDSDSEDDDADAN